MATRFAVATGNWSNTAIWDNGALPSSDDIIHANGFTVTIDQDITVASLRNTATTVTLPNSLVPIMTSNTQPSGIANSSGNAAGGFPYYVFDGSLSTSWLSTTNGSGWISYEFTSAKLIKRYYVKQQTVGGYGYPIEWRFEGWNTTTSSWDSLEYKSAMGTTIVNGYTSPVLTHTTSYSLYRFNILNSNAPGFPVNLNTFEMTDSTVAIYGGTTGGSFTVPNTLSGSRNIVQTGAGIISNSSNSVVQVINIQATSGNTVNFNVSGSGYIFNQYWYTANCNVQAVNITGNCTVNFNGDIWGSQQGGNVTNNSGGNIILQGNATVNINGNIYAAGGHVTSFAPIIQTYTGTSNTAVINITGNLIGTTTGYDVNTMIYANSTCTINITGTLTTGLGYCIYSIVGTQVNIPTGTITVNNSLSNSAIYLTSKSSLLTINSPVINKSNVNAIIASRIRFYSTGTPYWVFQDTTNTDITLAYGSATGAYPNEADVRFGTTYAASPTRTGTLRVPLPQYVSQGVLTDNTVGTAYLSATDVWNVLTSSITTAGSIGERLKNASTVETTGDQLAAYQV